MPDTVIASSARFGRGRVDPVELVGPSSAIARVREFVRRAAAVEGPVLLTAEDGSAVDSVARDVHARGRHGSGPFVEVDCAAADGPGLERALFGGPPGDARSDLEAVAGDSLIAGARGGVLFLAHVTELPASAQARLARVARDREVRIAGAAVATEFRLMASATPAVAADVDARRFRADLYRRLSAVRIDLPPLRDRREDVPAIAERLLEDVCSARGLGRRSFTRSALALIGAWSWTGNIRELHAVIDRTVGDSADEVIQVEQILPALRAGRAAPAFEPAGSLREARLRFERDYVAAVLQHHGWQMSHAARTLGIQRPNLYRKARQLGIPLMRVQ